MQHTVALSRKRKALTLVLTLLGLFQGHMCPQPPVPWITALGFEHSQLVIFYMKTLFLYDFSDPSLQLLFSCFYQSQLGATTILYLMKTEWMK